MPTKEYMKKYRNKNQERYHELSRKHCRTWRKKHPNYERDYYRKHKLELVQFMGGKCVRCGLKPEDVNFCLNVFVIDEINPIKEIDSKKKFTNLTKSRLKRAKQLFLEGKIQLLCSNCHRIKTWQNNYEIKRGWQ